MTSLEFSESMAYERLEPDPAEVTMHLVASLLTLTANVYRDPKSKPRPYVVDDFMPDPYGPPRVEREASFARVMADFARNSKHNKAH